MAKKYHWGAPRIYSEILKLGYSEKEISERTVSRYLKKFRPEDPEKLKKKQQQWKTFLNNHREHIMAMSFLGRHSYFLSVFSIVLNKYFIPCCIFDLGFVIMLYQRLLFCVGYHFGEPQVFDYFG